ncbi:MAG TPA: hypothetical protein VGD10_01915 [Allosphingosinicella sp.]|uniref:hypothetical protein n=1 Tax=Allosphingosinicella sp. TaxID=2823234 RepID=UPI002ED88603
MGRIRTFAIGILLHLAAFAFVCGVAGAILSLAMGASWYLAIPFFIGLFAFGAVFAVPLYLVAATGQEVKWWLATAVGFVAGATGPAIGGALLGVGGLGLLGALCGTLFWLLVAPFTYRHVLVDAGPPAIRPALFALLVLAVPLIAITARIYFEPREEYLPCEGVRPGDPDDAGRPVFHLEIDIPEAEWPTFETIMHGFAAEYRWAYRADSDEKPSKMLQVSTCNEARLHFLATSQDKMELAVYPHGSGDQWHVPFADLYGRIKRRWPDARLIGRDGEPMAVPEWLGQDAREESEGLRK